MPDLFIPLFICAGVWLAFGLASLPGEHNPRTSKHNSYAALAMMAFIAACGFGGALVATYVPPADDKVECGR